MAARSDPPVGHSITDVIDGAQAKIVKIDGVGGLQGMAAYQTGFLISSDGYILSVWRSALDTDEINVTLNDGRKYTAKVVGADPRIDVAVLKIEATHLPHFELADAKEVEGGARILALSNAYNVAMGNEQAGVQHGEVSVVTHLNARRGGFESPYHGPVYVLDAVTNNPGVAGGAVITHRGELVAMLGKELKSTLTERWLSYAVPIAQMRDSVKAIQAGKFVVAEADATEKKLSHPTDLNRLGIALVPDVVEPTPAYVDQVRPGSPAAKAGIQPDDLIVQVGNRVTHSCKAVRNECDLIDRYDTVHLTVQRGAEMDLIDVELKPADEDK